MLEPGTAPAANRRAAAAIALARRERRRSRHRSGSAFQPSGMPLSLQHLVDSLARQLGRAVALEDHRQRMITHSAQRGHLDQLRIDSILQRDTSDEIRTWYQQFNIEQAQEPVRIPAQPDLQMLARVCIPIRYSKILLGYLWLLDFDDGLTADDVELAVGNAQVMALVLYRERRLEGIASDALRSLLSSNIEARELGASEIAELDLFDPHAPVVAVVADPGVTYRAQHRDLEPEIMDALALARRRATVRRLLISERDGRGILLVSAERGWQQEARDIAHHVLPAFATLLSGPACGAVVGIGTPQQGLLHAALTYRQAERAARAATILPNQSVLEWSALGPYRALLEFPNRGDTDLIDPRLLRLITADESGTLTATLETYLDLAGDATRAATSLCVHRTTLYQRLARIEQLTELSLHDGLVRLSLHMSLKLVRLHSN